MLKNHIFLLILLFSVISCTSQISPEEEIEEYIASVEKRFEDRHATKLKKYIADEYIDSKGYTKKDLVRFAAGYILRRPAIYITTNISELNIIDGNKAQFKLDVSVSNFPTEDNDIRLVQGEFHRFFIDLEKTGKWQLRSLQWQKSTLDEYLDD